MSDSPAPTNKSSEGPATTAAKPKSSWIGRIIIGLLLVVLAIEAIAHLRSAAAEKALSAELAKAELEEHNVTPAQVHELLGRDPDQSKTVKVAVGDELYEVYKFKGLLKDRIVCAHYGVQGEEGTADSQRELMDVLSVVPEAILYEE